MDTYKLRQLVPTHSAIQLAVEHMPECTDQCKIESTASHIHKTSSGNNTDLLNGFLPVNKVAGA